MRIGIDMGGSHIGIGLINSEKIADVTTPENSAGR